MARHQIDEADVARVLSAPEQTENVRGGRVVYSRAWSWARHPRIYLLRVLVDVDRDLPEVVTVYRTGKIEEYWRVEP